MEKKTYRCICSGSDDPKFEYYYSNGICKINIDVSTKEPATLSILGESHKIPFILKCDDGTVLYAESYKDTRDPVYILISADRTHAIITN